MNTKAIEQFLMRPDEGGAYTDERLAILQAWTEDGGLSFYSCCCLVGVSTLKEGERLYRSFGDGPLHEHSEDYDRAYNGWGLEISHDFGALGSDSQARAKLLPLIHAEFARRESLATHNVTANTWDNDAGKEECFVPSLTKRF